VIGFFASGIWRLHGSADLGSFLHFDFLKRRGVERPKANGRARKSPDCFEGEDLALGVGFCVKRVI
jgi:hypothetical protein